ncbi:MAG: hypothetical protein ACXVAP_03085 [Candidatus Limnocylindrales bacterium]
MADEPTPVTPPQPPGPPAASPPLAEAAGAATGSPSGPPAPARQRGGRLRALAVGLLAILTCLTLVLSTVTLWTHQVALNTDRYVTLVGDISSQPEVIDAVSARVATQVVTALGVQSLLEQNLPPRVSFVAAPLTAALTDRLSQGLARVMASPQFQTVWLEANRFAHAKAVALLRGDTSVVTIENGVVTLNLLPLVGAALQQLQTMGLIPASITLPDLSSGQLPPELVQQLQSVLNVTIPPDLGQIPLFRAEKLASLQTAVKVFDWIVIGLIALTIALFALTVYLARNRLRMVLLVALGAIVAFALARMIIGGIESSIISAIGDDSAQTTVRSVVDELLGNMFALGRIILIGAVVLAVIAYLAGRPPWLTSLIEAGQAATTGPEGQAGGASLGAWAAGHRLGLLLTGFAIVGLVVVATSLGVEFALLAGGVLAILTVALLPGAGQRPSTSSSAEAA